MSKFFARIQNAVTRNPRWPTRIPIPKFVILIALLFFGQTAFAPNHVPSTSAHFETVSLDRLLNSDGTLNLNSGLSGSFDLTGWTVTLDSARGPVFAPQDGGAKQFAQSPRLTGNSKSREELPKSLEGTWSAFPHNGLGGLVNALAVTGTGDLYVGGTFTQTVDGLVTNLNGIAKFSGGAWSALPNNGLADFLGSPGSVTAFAVSGSDVYVGGYFNRSADGNVSNLNGVAKLSGGTTWSALPGNGFYGGVQALAVNGSGDLYVGGSFNQTADGSTTNLNNFAKLSSGTWSSPKGGLDSSVNALAISGNDVYVGGGFTQSFDGSVLNLNSIAKLIGGTTWSSLPNNGLERNGNVASVLALTVSGSTLYVGGYFTGASDGNVQNLNNIAKLSGGTWSPLAGNSLNDIVRALAISGSDLYVAGNFTQTFDGSVKDLNHIAKYSNGGWFSLPHQGLNSSALALTARAQDIYVGGAFTQTFDGAVTNLGHIAKYESPTQLFLPIIQR
jgi:hypothetical protein